MARVDVLIIGGGAIGLGAAYYLTRSGRKVTVLDRAAIGQGSSSGNAGHIVPSHIVPLAAPGVMATALRWLLDPPNSPLGLKASLSPSYLGWLLRFGAACTEANVTRAIPPFKALGLFSAKNFAELISAERFDCAYQAAGLLYLYKTESAFEAGRHEAELLRRHGMAADVLDRDAVHRREPTALDGVIGGVNFSGDASLDPGVYLHLLKERLRAMGAALRDDTPVTRLATGGGRITHVVTPGAEFEPALVILAAGDWSPQVGRGLGLNIPIQPARGYSLTMHAPRTMPRGALLLGERKIAVTPMGDRLRFTGRLEIGQMSTVPSARWIARIEQAVREYMALDARLEIEQTWAGLRPTTPDGMPIIGKSPRHQNLILATGHAMLGLSLSPGTGQVVAELANGIQPAVDIGAFGPERFQPKR